jgi:hypothetical protein
MLALMTPETCPQCGADVPPQAKSCPECGSCEATGWSDMAHADRLGLPDESFDYDEFVQEEFASPSTRPRRRNWFWWTITAIVLVILLLWMI